MDTTKISELRTTFGKTQLIILSERDLQELLNLAEEGLRSEKRTQPPKDKPELNGPEKLAPSIPPTPMERAIDEEFENLRYEFEMWARKRGFGTKRDATSYVSQSTTDAWDGWLAARSFYKAGEARWKTAAEDWEMRAYDARKREELLERQLCEQNERLKESQRYLKMKEDALESVKKQRDRGQRELESMRELLKNLLPPWKRDGLASWQIVGMNHYRAGGGDNLFVAMTNGSKCIRAEGHDDDGIWLSLRKQAEEFAKSPPPTDLQSSDWAPGWILPDPPAGQEWHRLGWTRTMLPDGYRPLLKHERVMEDDEFLHQGNWRAVTVIGCPAAAMEWIRTKRPLP